MLKEKKVFYGLYAFALVIFLAGLIVGSFKDLDISKALYDSNSVFGLIFASFGELPCWLLINIAGVSLIRIFSKEKKSVKKIAFIIIGALLICAATYFNYNSMGSKWNGLSNYLAWYYILILSLVIEGLMVLFAFKFINNDDKETVLKVIAIFAIACALELIIIYILKFIFLRPRYRLIYDGYPGYNVDVLFRNWYEVGAGFAKTLFTDAPIEQFRSFPSGHTGDATTALLLFYLPLLNKKTKDKEYLKYIFFGFGLLWAMTVALSRIVYGAHYLSDVSFGGLMTIISAFFTISVITRKKNKEKQVK